jgi:fibronectin type 3 domain-containing protein
MAHQALLSWVASTDPVDGYRIYKGTAGAGSEGATPLNSALVTATSFTDPDVTEGETLAYYVTSVKGTLESIHSNEVTAEILPAPPTGLTVTVS